MKLALSEAALVASICRDSFYEFLREFWHVIIEEAPVWNWHIEYLCQELQDLAERVFAGWPREYDLVINIPPGTTKSTICSQAFPAWCWTRYPSAKLLCGSYAYQIALKDSLKTRDLVLSDLYQAAFPGITLREDENTKGLFTNTRMGFRLSVGVGGLATGYHGHFLVVDDPINPEGSYSAAELKKTYRWLSTTFLPRRLDKDVSPLIVVQQRLAQEDISGMLLEELGSSKVRHICLPAERTDKISPSFLASRYVDGLLDPVRLPRRVLEGLRKEMGVYGYASQYLQDPVPLEGGLFQIEKIVVHEVPPANFIRVVRSWDKAGTEGGGAWTVGVKMGVDGQGRYWVLDVVRGQWDAGRREAVIRQTADLDGEAVEIVLEVEGGSGGKESAEATVRNLAGHAVYTYHPSGPKESRAYAFASQVGAGNVFCVRAPWTLDYLDELRCFPAGRYKDQVDASSGAFHRLWRRSVRVGGWKQPEPAICTCISA